MLGWHSPFLALRSAVVRQGMQKRAGQGAWRLRVAGVAGVALAVSAVGAGQAAPDDVLVPTGEFTYGDNHGEEDERPARRITLPAFQIDRTEVSVAAYAACVAARACRPPLHASKDPRLPVVGVSQADAAAYCAFVGKRLPTEHEWEKAARGLDARAYPWGNDFACERGNFGNFAGDGRCAEDGAPGRPVAVGSFPSGASPYGVLDLAGNVWEWVDGRAGPVAARVAGSPEHELRVLRGGGCCSILGLPRASNRLVLPGGYRDVDIGFRCARSASKVGPSPQVEAASGHASHR